MGTDPHADDFCVVCGQGATPDGPQMFPVEGFTDACVCAECGATVDADGSPVTMSTYERRTDETAIYPDEIPEWMPAGLLYVALGLGEVGEVQGKVKKAIREDDKSYIEQIPDENGDVLWYVARLPQEVSKVEGIDWDGGLDDVARENLAKLFDRKERGVIEGSGDDR